MSEQMPCFWGTSSSIAMNSSTLNPEAAFANVEIVTKDKVVARDEDDNIIGDLRRVEDKFVDDLLVDQSNVDGLLVDQSNVDEESLLLPDDNLFQLVSELEIQKYALPPCIVDEHQLDGVHLPIEEVKLLEKADCVDKSKGKEQVKETEQRRSPCNDHHHKATKKISKKRNRDQRSKRRQINEKLQTLQKLIPKSDTSNKRDYASILNDAIDHIKFMKHQIETMLTWRGMRHFQQGAYTPATYMPMMMRPNVQLGAAMTPNNAIAGAEPMPTITPMLYPLPPHCRHLACTGVSPYYTRGNFES